MLLVKDDRSFSTDNEDLICAYKDNGFVEAEPKKESKAKPKAGSKK